MPPEERLKRDQNTVDLFNKVAKDPIQMCLFVQELMEGLGQWLMIPTPILEQIINSEEVALKQMLEQAANPPIQLPALGKLAELGAKDCRQKLAILKAFHANRTKLIESAIEFGLEKLDQLPD